MSSQSVTVIIPVAAAIAKAEVPSVSAFSLPLAMVHVRPVVSPVVAIVPTAAEQDVDSA